MGDVKRSGKTFEERKAIAIAKQKVEAELKIAKRKEIGANITPEQKMKNHKVMMDLMMLWMVGAYSLPRKLK